MADPANETGALERAQLPKHDWSGATSRVDHVAGTHATLISHESQNLPRACREPGFQCPIDGRRRQRDACTARRLHIFGITQARQPHLLVNAADPLAQLLTELKICADPGDPWIARETRDVERVSSIGNTRESARALDLDAVVEDRDSHVVTAHAVRTVDDRVDERFEPCVVRNEFDTMKSSAGSERAARRHVLEDDLACLLQLHRDRSVDTDVVQELLTSPRATLGPASST